MDFLVTGQVLLPTAIGGTTVIVSSVYEPKGVVELNAAYQLEGTFWATKDGQKMPQSLLGTASYQVRDKNGVAVVGLSESGLTADSNGFFKLTPVDAKIIKDLTHYTVEITIIADLESRTAVLGWIS